MSHFKALFEHTIERFNFGGVQIHDYVKIISTDVEGASPSFIKELKKFRDSELNIKVLDINTDSYSGDRQSPDHFSIVLGLESISGIFPNKITVPSKILEVVGYNVPPSIPDSWKHKCKSDRKGDPEVLIGKNDIFVKSADDEQRNEVRQIKKVSKRKKAKAKKK